MTMYLDWMQVACGTIDKSHFLCPLSVIQAQWVTLDGVQLLVSAWRACVRSVLGRAVAIAG